MIKFQHIKKILLVIPVTVGLISCSQKGIQQEVEDATPESVTEVQQDIENLIVDQHEFQLGLDALSIGDDESAKQIFQRFSRKNPGLSGAYLNLALIAYRQADFAEAERLTGRVLQLNPQHAEAHHLQALLHQQKGDIKQAEQAYKKAIRLKPDYVNAHYNLALLYDIFLQQLQLAIKHYSQYLELLDREDNETRDWIKHLQNSLANG